MVSTVLATSIQQLIVNRHTVKPEMFTTFLFSRLSRIRKIREIKKSEKFYIFFISDSETGVRLIIGLLEAMLNDLLKSQQILMRTCDCHICLLRRRYTLT